MVYLPYIWFNQIIIGMVHDFFKKNIAWLVNSLSRLLGERQQLLWIYMSPISLSIQGNVYIWYEHIFKYIYRLYTCIKVCYKKIFLWYMLLLPIGGAGSVCIQPPFSWRLAPSTKSDVTRVVMLEKSRSISTPFWNPKSTAKDKALQENTIFTLKCGTFYVSNSTSTKISLLPSHPFRDKPSPPFTRFFSNHFGTGIFDNRHVSATSLDLHHIPDQKPCGFSTKDVWTSMVNIYKSPKNIVVNKTKTYISLAKHYRTPNFSTMQFFKIGNLMHLWHLVTI